MWINLESIDLKVNHPCQSRVWIGLYRFYTEIFHITVRELWRNIDSRSSSFKTLYILVGLCDCCWPSCASTFSYKAPAQIAKVGIVNEPFNPPSFSGYRFIGYRFPRHRLWTLPNPYIFISGFCCVSDIFWVSLVIMLGPDRSHLFPSGGLQFRIVTRSLIPRLFHN